MWDKGSISMIYFRLISVFKSIKKKKYFGKINMVDMSTIWLISCYAGLMASTGIAHYTMDNYL